MCFSYIFFCLVLIKYFCVVNIRYCWVCLFVGKVWVCLLLIVCNIFFIWWKNRYVVCKFVICFIVSKFSFVKWGNIVNRLCFCKILLWLFCIIWKVCMINLILWMLFVFSLMLFIRLWWIILWLIFFFIFCSDWIVLKFK